MIIGRHYYTLSTLLFVRKQAYNILIIFSKRGGNKWRKQLSNMNLLCPTHIAQVELKAITELYGGDVNPRFFIINIDDTTIKEESLNELTYILLPLKRKTEAEIKERIKEIVHKQIKKYIIQETLSDFGDSYGISIRTLFAEGNTPIWEPQYNWNLFTTEFINTESCAW